MNRKLLSLIAAGACASILMLALPVCGAVTQSLRGHVPAISAGLRPQGRLPGTNRLNLAISLPLRNREALTNLLHDIYNPASPNFRHFLTPQEFTARFGPTEKDFNAVVAYAKANGFTVTQTHSNRVILDVNASVADIEKTFHVGIRTYAHPSEKRNFYAPDAEPSLGLSVPIAHISGLDNANRPRPRWKIAATNSPNASPNSGSGVSGTYAGNDFRAAYVPDSSLTGAGQTVGLLQFDGYTVDDITNYEALHGLPNVPLTNVFLDGFNGQPSGNGGEVEVSLDIEMAMSMAPGLSGIIVYQAGPFGNWHDILNRMANDNLAQQLSCSWYIRGGPSDAVADGIFQQMALQGQSFFNASGDFDAFTTLVSFPGDSPFITQVGGTTLTTTGPGGSRVSETVWNRGNGDGTGGGISTQYSIPAYQTNISMDNNQGSTTMRNIPDVALTAEEVEVCADGGRFGVGGTSCAAPLWAGFAALVNQQAASSGRSPMGLANQAFDTIGTGATYTLCFNDITDGNNTNFNSPDLFFAAPGYDLCTGWGTPAGQALINALAIPEPLLILPSHGFQALGGAGGPFSISSQSLTLTNTGTNALSWTLTNAAPWLSVSSTSGSLTPGGPAATVTVSLNTAASNLLVGNYSTTIWVTNLNDNYGQSLQYSLVIIAPPSIDIQPTNQSVLDGQTAIFSTFVSGGTPLVYQWQLNGTNLTDGGKISGCATNVLTINNVSTNNAGVYTLLVTNAAGAVTSSNAVLSLTPSAPVITQQPADQTVYVNFNAHFFAAAVGTKPFFYQWSLNGTNLSGATNASLNVTNAQLNQSGNYAVSISNSINATLSSNAVLTVTPLPACDPPVSGLVSWWRAEGDALDSAGNNNGQLAAGVAYGPGEVEQAFVFPDSGSAVELGNPANLQLQDFSVEAWIQRSASAIIPNGPDELIFASGSAGYGFGLKSDGRLFLTQVDISSDTSANGVSDTNWHHVAVTKVGTKVMFYVDGVAYSGGQYQAFFSFNNDFAIGARGDDLASSFYGSIDELAVYNRELEPSEMQLIYIVGAGGKCPIPPTIVSQPLDETVYAGNTAFFSVTATGAQPMAYQWMYNATNLIADATNSSLLLVNAQMDQAGSYSVLITNVGGSVLSSNAMLTVNPAPPCAPVPAGLVGWWKAEFNALDSWGTNNGTAFNGMTYGPGEVGQAFVFPGNGSGVQLDNPTNLQLQDFTIEAWIQRDGFTIVPNNSDQLFMAYGSAGYGFGLKSDGRLFLTQIDINNVTVQYGVSDTNWHHVAVTKDGTTVVFYVDGVAYPADPYDVTYEFNSNVAIGVRGDELPDAVRGSTNGPRANDITGSFYGSIDEVAIYDRALTSSEIQAISAAGAGGKCLPPPVIVTDLTNQTVDVGDTATLTVSVIGAQPLIYQWLFNATNVIVGATNASLTLTNLQPSNAGNYSVLVTNLYGSAMSSNATLTVLSHPPAITMQPSNAVAYVGDTVQFSVTATGSPTLGYQWILNDSGFIPGATNTTLTLATIQTYQAGNYSCLVTNAYGAALSSDAGLVVQPILLCDPPPSGLVGWWKAEGNALDAASVNNGTLVNGVTYGHGEVGQAFVFPGNGSAVLVGNPLSLQLQDFTMEAWIQRTASSIVSNSPDELIIAGGSASYGFGLTSDGRLFLTQIDISNVTISNGVSDTNWHHVAVTKVGSTVIFYVDGVAYPAPSYNPLFSFGANVGIGARGDALTGSFFGSIDELAVYNRALTTTEIHSIYQASANGKCAPPVGIVTQPVSQLAMTNCSAGFSVVATGQTPFTYQWWKDGVALNGQTNSGLSINSIHPTNFGTYFVIVGNAFGNSAISSNALLALDHLPVPGSDTIGRFASGGVTFPASTLLTNDTDADGDRLSVVAVSTNSSASGTVSLQGNFIYYAPPVGYTNSDTFTYTVSDGRCGGTATGHVIVQVQPDNTPSGTYLIQLQAGGAILLNFYGGIPGRAYRIQYSDTIISPNWQDLGTQIADNFGTCQFTDSSHANSRVRFYRAISP